MLRSQRFADNCQWWLIGEIVSDVIDLLKRHRLVLHKLKEGLLSLFILRSPIITIIVCQGVKSRKRKLFFQVKIAVWANIHIHDLKTNLAFFRFLHSVKVIERRFVNSSHGINWPLSFNDTQFSDFVLFSEI